MTQNLDSSNKLADWEKVLMANGYTPKDIVTIVTEIIDFYEEGKRQLEEASELHTKEISGAGS